MVKEYIHLRSIGNLTECKKKQDEIINALDQLFERGQIKGHNSIIIESDAHAEDQWIQCKPENYIPLTHNQFPFLLAQLEPTEISLDELMKKKGYESVSS